MWRAHQPLPLPGHTELARERCCGLYKRGASPSVREVRALPSRWPKTSKFSDAKLAFSLGKASNSNTVQSVAPPGDPTVAKIGGSWYIYYGARDGIHYATLK
jgi:hypothetical protein